EIESVYHNEYWTEEFIKAFTFTIYDSSFNIVGKISDQVRLAPNETKAVEVVLDPSISAKFFNTDDKYEVMVFFAMNTPQYINHYYYKVYSIDGEKDSEGNDISIATMEGRCVDATNAALPGAEENFFYTFVHDPEVDEAKAATYPTRADYLNTLTYDLTTYSKATATEGPKEYFKKSIYSTRIPGDTTDGIYFISKTVDGTFYMVYSEYAKPYFIDPTGGAANEQATPDNSLKIEVYSTAGAEAALLSTTLIPVVELSTPNELIYSFYSIGSVAWSDDVDMMVNGTPSAPAFIVARDFANAATLEDVTSSYDIFANDGTIIKNLSNGTESIIVFPSDGTQPQVMFIRTDENQQYQFAIVDLYTVNTVFTIPQANNGDPLTAVCARVKGENGAYNYVFGMSNYEIDEADCLYIRLAWFAADGKLDRIDRINMGTNVQYATVNLDPYGLNPYLYDADEGMEYAVLVKRTVGSTTRNEFLVVDDNGETLVTFTDDDGKGAPFNFTLLPGDPARIMMVYNDGYRFNVDLYNLPLQLSDTAIDEIESAPAPDAIYFDLNGRRVANPAAGIFIKKAGASVSKVIIE
ncbi:MAG: hypothetical protein J1E29_01065, partial [Duncaniella sp.]|nr:hypothetical protein [Duncaniella sp.]